MFFLIRLAQKCSETSTLSPKTNAPGAKDLSYEWRHQESPLVVSFLIEHVIAHISSSALKNGTRFYNGNISHCVQKFLSDTKLHKLNVPEQDSPKGAYRICIQQNGI